MHPQVQNYFEQLPEGRRGIVLEIHQLILTLFPQALLDFEYKMPTYKIKTGWVALANRKHYVSFYTCGARHLQEFKQSQPEIKTGRCCINFKAKAPLPVEALSQVIEHAMTQGHKD